MVEAMAGTMIMGMTTPVPLSVAISLSTAVGWFIVNGTAVALTTVSSQDLSLMLMM